MASLNSEMKKAVVNGYALSNLEKNEWTRCFHQPYSHKTKVKDIISNCPIDDNVYLFVCALPSSSSNLAYVGAFCPSSVLITKTTSRYEVFKPQKFKSDNEYKVYWYNWPGHSFGFAPTSKVDLNSPDLEDQTNEQRLSWYITGSHGGYRAGSNTSIQNDNVWYKAVYYKRFDEETEGKQDAQTQPVVTINERMDKLEQMMTDLQRSMMQMTEKVNGLESRMNEENKNDETNDLCKEMQSLRKDVNVLKEAVSDLSMNNQDVQEMKNWMTNTVGLPQYIDLFIENGLDRLSFIQHVGMNDLKQIGMDKHGHMIAIVKEIQKLNAAK